MEEIDDYHRRTLGWPGIGYHVLIRQDGTIYLVSELNRVRYNVAGRNSEVVGIVLSGNFTTKQPTVGQLNSLAYLLPKLRYDLGRNIPVVGHKDLGPTFCPGNWFRKEDWN